MQVERDHSLLPDVQVGLFDYSSFGGSSRSPLESAMGGAEGEVLSAGGVHLKDKQCIVTCGYRY